MIAVDGGSSDSITSHYRSPKAKSTQTPSPNFVRWLKTSGEVLLQHACQITFAISEDYKYTMWHDVVLMDCREKLSIWFWSPF